MQTDFTQDRNCIRGEREGIGIYYMLVSWVEELQFVT